MSYFKAKRYFPGAAPSSAPGDVGVINIDAASNTTAFTWVPQSPVVIYGWGGVAVQATGSQTTTVGVGSLVIGSTEVGTLTAAVSSAIGTEKLGANMTPQKVAAGTSVIFKTKTQAVGGTVTGEYAPFLICEIFDAVTPA